MFLKPHIPIIEDKGLLISVSLKSVHRIDCRKDENNATFHEMNNAKR